MSRKLTPKQVEKHTEQAVEIMKNCLFDLIANGQHDKADKLCFWIKDWVKFLSFEDHFSPAKLKRYKRGEIIRAHLGFNVGSEYGGLHYCVVLDKNNSKNSPVVTVAPLTSVKEHTNLKKLYPGNIYLGDEVYQKISDKGNKTYGILSKQGDALNRKFEAIDKRDLKHPETYPTPETHDEWLSKTQAEFDAFFRNKKTLKKILERINSMKSGSIALVGQIKTISKIRIYEPRHGKDPLSNIRLSSESLDLIDLEIKKLYTNL